MRQRRKQTLMDHIQRLHPQQAYETQRKVKGKTNFACSSQHSGKISSAKIEENYLQVRFCEHVRD